MDKGVIRMLTELEQLGKLKHGLAKVFDDVDSLIFKVRLNYIKRIRHQLKYTFSRKWYLVLGTTNQICTAVLEKRDGKMLSFMSKDDTQDTRIPLFKRIRLFSTSNNIPMYRNRPDALARQIEYLSEERDYFRDNRKGNSK